VIDVSLLRILAAILLTSSFLLIYQVNFEGNKDSQGFDVKKEVIEPPSIQVAGNIVTIFVPMIAVVLLILFPGTVYGTVLNIQFYGDTLIQVLGVVIYLAGAILLVWSSKTLDKYDTGRIAVAEDHVLVDTGPYARVRHPGYIATFMLALSVFLILLNIILILDLIAAAAYFVYRARLEEDLLSSEENLGDQYRTYIQRTGRFFPRLGRNP